jgi:hypothetical protein
MFTIQIDKFNIVTSLSDNDNIFITILTLFFMNKPRWKKMQWLNTLIF